MQIETGKMSGDECRYVFGHTKNETSSFPTLVVMSPFEKGWRARSTDPSYNHDYVCHEPFAKVMEWLDDDLRRPFVCANRDDAVDAMISANVPATGFLLPTIECSPYEAVDKVLQHLETDWGRNVWPTLEENE